VIVESWREAAELDALAGDRSIQQGILVRIAPSRVPRGFGVNMAGKPTQFGIDEEVLEDVLPRIQSLRALDLHGFHIYSGTQCLNVESIAENYAIFIELFRRFSKQAALEPRKLIFGSGIGIPYHEGTSPVDLAALAERVNPMLDSLRADARFRETELVLEIGRYLVGEAGLYVTRVLRRKSSRGAELCICDGGMHHHLGACGHLGSVIHRNYRMFKVGGVGPDDRAYDLVGPLCTSIDTLGHAVRLPEMKEGDLIAVHCSGAYGPTASPLHFIGHAPPREFLVEHHGEGVRVIDVSEFGCVTAPDLVILGDR